jgi:hypothetical protein
MRKLLIVALFLVCYSLLSITRIPTFSPIASAQQSKSADSAKSNATPETEKLAPQEKPSQDKLLQDKSPQDKPPQDKLSQASGSITLRGRVVDAQSGEPVAKVKLNVLGSQQSATTDENGSFILQQLQPGELELYITTVGYGLVKRVVLVKDVDTETEIALNQEAAALTEQITVTAGPYEPVETNAASQQTLNKTELQDLSKVLIGDPLRAAQSLPGVTANNDLRSEFSVRGADFRRTGIYLDDILTDNFLHLVPGNDVEKITISVINTDTIRSVTLLSGAFPARFGDSTAAVLNLQTRDGNRIKPAFRIATGLQLGTSGVVDGPFAGKRGSWLVSARSSVLDYVARVVDSISNDDEDEDSSSADFSDIHSKIVYDLSPRNQLGGSAIFGVFLLDENVPRDQITDPNFSLKGHSRNLNVNAFWKYTPGPRLLAQTRVFGLRSEFGKRNRDDIALEDAPRTQLGVRSDINLLANRAHRVEAGLYVRSIHAEKVGNIFIFSDSPQPFRFESFDRRATEQGYYAQDTWSAEHLAISLTGGARIDHSGLTGETVASPRASFSIAPAKNWTVRAGVGRYYQFPDFDPLLGRLGNASLRAERATHYNVSIERMLGERTRVIAEAYDREDSNLLFSLSEPRIEAGSITFAQFPFRNALRGQSRGIELTLQRRSANRLTGWLSYAYSKTRLRDEQNDLSFAGDFDQRHTVSANASYRFTETFNLSGQWRYGSGQPLAGFFALNEGVLSVGSERNQLRFPAYSRVDVRVNKAFLFKKSKLTLSAEVLNVLNRENRSYLNFIGVVPGGRIFGDFAPSFPFLPSVGIAIEF